MKKLKNNNEIRALIESLRPVSPCTPYALHRNRKYIVDCLEELLVVRKLLKESEYKRFDNTEVQSNEHRHNNHSNVTTGNFTSYP